MYVPKWLVQVVLAIGAVCAGWMAKDALGGAGSSSADAGSTDRDELVEALASLPSSGNDLDDTGPMELTIVLGQGAEPSMTVSAATDERRGATGTQLGGTTAPGTTAATGTGGTGTTATETRTGTGSASTPTRVIVAKRAVAYPRGHEELGAGGGATDPAGASQGAVPAGNGSSNGLTFQLTPEMAATAIGEDIVIAYDDSIVLVGDNGVLTGNTGDAGQGGVVALDAQDSAFSTNSTSREAAEAADAALQANATMLAPGGTGTGTDTSTARQAGGYVPNAPPGVVSPLISPIVSFSNGRAVDIAGYEDHSLSVRGRRNVVTYDDSNVFIDRNGQINANTGDTDSAGLNAVDTVRSNVTAGPHCDDGCDDESIIQAEAGVFDEGDVAIDGDGNVVFAPDAGTGAGADSGDDSLPGDTGDDDDAEDDESDDGDVSDPVEPPETRQEADSTREAAGTGVEPMQAPAGDSLVIGGDGYDDLGVRVDGDDQVVTYDDSNVVMGGTGDVNAQIGDSDTGGTVSMHTVDSEVHGGNSR